MDYRLTFSEYRDALKQGLFKGLKCRQCKGLMIPPRNVCTECGSEDLEIVEFLKEGEMQTFTVIFVAPEGFVAPYIVAMVKLDDGPIVMGNLEGVDPLKVTMELMGRRVKIGHRILPADKHSSVEKVTLTFHLIDQVQNEFSQVCKFFPIDLSGEKMKLKCLYKPVNAAISEDCLGGGLEIVMACHLWFANQTAGLGPPEINNVTIPTFGGINYQQTAKAVGLLLTGELISSKLIQTEDLMEGIAAFFERRRGVFKNGQKEAAWKFKQSPL